KPRAPKHRTPVIHVAQMPDVKQPTPPPKAAEPAPQKPEIRLPQDAIASAKAGGRPPLEHLTAKVDKSKKKPSPTKPERKTEEASPTESRTGKPRGRRDAVAAPRDDVDTTLAGMASARADRQKSRRSRQTTRSDEGDR